MSTFTGRWVTWMPTGAAATHGPEPTDKTDETPPGGDWEHPCGQRRPEEGADKTDESTSGAASVSFVSASGPTARDNTGGDAVAVHARRQAERGGLSWCPHVFGRSAWLSRPC